MNIIDIVIIAVAIIVIIASAKKGFVASFLDTFSIVISSFVSYKLSPVVADSMYNLFIRDLVRTEFKQALDEMASNISIGEKVTGMINALPETAVKLASSMGIDVNNFSSALVSSANTTNEALIDYVADTLAYDVMISLTKIIVFVILFILATLLIRFISSFFSNNLEKLPIIGGIDTLVGGILGVVKAAVIVFAGSILLYIAVQTAEPGSPLEAIKASQIYMFMEQYNPIIEIIRGV
jgi:uncharacterized membrane protein required for colicin V production